MMPLSARYVWPAVVLLLLALLSVLSTRGEDRLIDDCADRAALYASEALGNQVEDVAAPKRARTAGTVRVRGHRRPLTLGYAVFQSHRPNKLYLRPQNHLFRAMEPEQARTEWIERDSERIPVHLVRDSSGEKLRIVAFLYVYRSEAVAHPFLAQLRGVVPALIEGTPPMTMFVIGGTVRRADLPNAEAGAKAWLFDAWQHYRFACRVPDAGAS